MASRFARALADRPGTFPVARPRTKLIKKPPSIAHRIETIRAQLYKVREELRSQRSNRPRAITYLVLESITRMEEASDIADAMLRDPRRKR